MKKVLENIGKNKGCYFLTIFTFLIGIWFIFCNLGVYFPIFLQIALLGNIPFLLFFSFSILKNILHTQKAKVLVSSAIILCGIFLPFYYFYAIFFSAISEIDNSIINPKYYKLKINDPTLLQAFPKEIPKNVTNVVFIVQPGFLQGGSIISLYYVDSQLNVEAFHNQYKDKAIWSGTIQQYDQSKYNLSFYKTPVENKNESDFLIYLIDGKCDDSGYCNHGYFLFVAINEKTKEIVYKEEQW